MKRLAVLSLTVGLFGVPIQAQAQQYRSSTPVWRPDPSSSAAIPFEHACVGSSLIPWGSGTGADRLRSRRGTVCGCGGHGR